VRHGGVLLLARGRLVSPGGAAIPYDIRVNKRSFAWLCRVAALGCMLSTPFLAARSQEEPEQDIRLPSGKLQREEILKAEHKKSLRDVDQLRKLADELKAELEKNDYHVLSVSSLKKTEEIEKLARQIRKRMQR
jgi:hypothetical protein